MPTNSIITYKCHFQPEGGYFGDPMPFYWDGEYHVFYLKASLRNKGVENLVWAHIKSNNLLNWKILPDVLPVGQKNDPDEDGCWSGSVIHNKGKFYIFYTGVQGMGTKSFHQSICIAESDDLIHFRKSPQNPILSINEKLYDVSGIAWADPFVFWNEKENSFWMLINSKCREGISPKNGCIGLAKSRDLKKWKVGKPFYTPNTAPFLEVPELFYYRSKWYLFYSETADFCMTHYRLSDKSSGSWRMPHRGDTIDGSEFYAAKTIFDQDYRYALGWIRRKEGNKDFGQPLWGGALGIPRKLIPRGDGSLKVYYPESWKTVRKEKIILKLKCIFGNLEILKDNFKLSASEGAALSLCEMEQNNFYFSCKIRISETTPYFGFILRSKDNLTQAYRIRFDRISGKIAAHGLGVNNGGVFGTALELVQRPLNVYKKNEFKFEMFADNDIVEVFVDEEIAMSFRTYEQSGKGFGLFVEEGEAEFKECEFHRM